jgi:hypothetical protein
MEMKFVFGIWLEEYVMSIAAVRVDQLVPDDLVDRGGQDHVLQGQLLIQEVGLDDRRQFCSFRGLLQDALERTGKTSRWKGERSGVNRLLE